jgi:hypothetical protein
MTLIILLHQAEIVGRSIGDGIVRLIVMLLIAVGVISAVIAFLWLVRRIDKKINK